MTTVAAGATKNPALAGFCFIGQRQKPSLNLVIKSEAANQGIKRIDIGFREINNLREYHTLRGVVLLWSLDIPLPLQRPT